MIDYRFIWSEVRWKMFDIATILFIGRVFGVAKPGGKSNDNGST